MNKVRLLKNNGVSVRYPKKENTDIPKGVFLTMDDGKVFPAVGHNHLVGLSMRDEENDSTNEQISILKLDRDSEYEIEISAGTFTPDKVGFIKKYPIDTADKGINLTTVDMDSELEIVSKGTKENTVIVK